jgi:uncharacterized protein (TIGR01319 family)
MTDLVCCVDFGSTFTKAALVDTGSGALVGTASHPTTLASDVLDGWQACLADLSRVEPGATAAAVLACSSAGGGLRLGVVGNEELVTAEAGRRVALSSGGRVVHVVSGGLTEESLADLHAQQPDVVLLVGGTDGGNAEVLLHSAGMLAIERWPGPVVVAGNAEVQGQVSDLLGRACTPHVVTRNVVPQIGVLQPEPARAAIRETFVRHVIGGKHLSTHAEFLSMVRGATPDVVLSAVELLAQGSATRSAPAGEVVAVDVGGATTDVHSVVQLEAHDDADLAREVVAPVPVTRTVEGDLGMRASAISTLDAGRDSGLLSQREHKRLAADVEHLHDDPTYVPSTQPARAVDARLARVAVELALRRHAGRQQVTYGVDGRQIERSGTDLREVRLLIGSGGVLRHNGKDFGHDVLAQACVSGESAGWLLPSKPAFVVDVDYVLAPAGLLADEHPDTALALMQRLYAEERHL